MKNDRHIFSPTCCSIMDFFIDNFELYFTPTTTALSMDSPLPTIKDCMSILYGHGFLSKHSKTGATYYITFIQMRQWRDVLKHYLEAREEETRALENGLG